MGGLGLEWNGMQGLVSGSLVISTLAKIPRSDSLFSGGKGPSHLPAGC